MAKRKTYWFHPKSHTNWKKTQSPATRRRLVLASTPKSKSKHDRLVLAGRKIGSLCNVTKDKGTKIKACADAKYFYKKAKETPE